MAHVPAVAAGPGPSTKPRPQTHSFAFPHTQPFIWPPQLKKRLCPQNKIREMLSKESGDLLREDIVRVWGLRETRRELGHLQTPATDASLGNMAQWEAGGKRKGSFTQNKIYTKSQAPYPGPQRGIFTIFARLLLPASAPYMESSLFTSSANLNRAYRRPCQPRFGPVGDKDLPTNKEETHTSYLQIQSFTTYENGQVSIRKAHPHVLCTKTFTAGGMPGEKTEDSEKKMMQGSRNSKNWVWT